MTTEFINHYFHSELERIEDIFVGNIIHPKENNEWVVIERIFYKFYNESDIEESRVKSRKELDSYDYENKYNEDYDYTTLNYTEIDLDFWEDHLYHYNESRKKELDSFFKEVDAYIQSNIDFQTKKFTLNSLKDRISYCISCIETDIPKIRENIYSKELNSHEKNLLDAFHNLYSSSKDRIESERYRDYIEIVKIEAIETKTNKIEKPLGGVDSFETVFGKNFNFIEKLYEQLNDKGFINVSKEQFFGHFYITQQESTRITIKGSNLSDCAMLIDELKVFFIEPYNDSSFFNSFWADRFLFDTNKKVNISKNNKGISKMLSDYKIGNRQAIKKSTIKAIIQNLQSNPQ